VKRFLKIVLMLMNSLLLGFGYILDNGMIQLKNLGTKNKSFKYLCTLNLSILMDLKVLPFINENILEQD